jgi:hypothetical protein
LPAKVQLTTNWTVRENVEQRVAANKLKPGDVVHRAIYRGLDAPYENESAFENLADIDGGTVRHVSKRWVCIEKGNQAITIGRKWICNALVVGHTAIPCPDCGYRTEAEE